MKHIKTLLIKKKMVYLQVGFYDMAPTLTKTIDS